MDHETCAEGYGHPIDSTDRTKWIACGCEIIKGAGSQSLENVDMMAENTDDNVPQNNNRQSMDDAPDFLLDGTSVQITDASMSENVSENQKQKTFSARWDVGISDVFLRKDSISSIHSCDSGYASRKCTGNSDFSKDEEKCQLQTRPAAQTKSTPKM